jgi:tyrosine-protein kinase Etk/Wzc
MREIDEPAGAGTAREMDLKELVGLVTGGRRLLLATLVLTLLLGIAYVVVAPPVYEADALVQVESEDKSVNAMLGDVAELLGAQTPVTAEIEILRSRLVLSEVADRVGLEIVAEPRYLPVVGNAIARFLGADAAAPVDGPAPFAWGAQRIRVATFDVPPRLMDEPLTLRAIEGGFELYDDDGAAILTGRVGELAEGRAPAGPVRIAVRELAAVPGTEFRLTRRDRGEVLAALAETLAIAERGKQSGVVGVTYEDTDAARATEVVDTLARAYLHQNVARRSAEAEQTLAFVQEQLPKVRASLEAAEAALNAFRLKQGSVDLTTETQLLLAHSVELETQRVQLEQNRQALLQRLTETHPAVKPVEAQLRQIEREQAEVAARAKGLPEIQQDLLRLARDVQVNTDIYTLLLNNAQQLQLARAGTVGNVRVIDFPLRPTKPARPRAAIVLPLSAVLGLALGMLAIFVRRALTHGVEDPAVVERALGLPTYATIPYARAERRLARAVRGVQRQLLAQVEPADPAIEALRSLRTSLHFATVEPKSNVLVLTGPSPDLGKSFVAMNLAAVLATGRRSVVVVDADLRKGRVHEHVSPVRAPGLSEFVAGNATLEDILRESGVAGLSLIATGTLPANPAELLMHERMARLLESLSKRFDHVLVDTPPVLAVTDATIVGRLAGSTLLVLKAGAHPLRAIEDTVRQLRRAGVEVRGSIFNQVGAAGSHYAYGYGYGYTYEYRGESTGGSTGEGTRAATRKASA